MHSIWVSLKENVNCGSKLTDVIQRPQRFIQSSSSTLQNEKSSNKLVHHMENQMREAIFRQNFTQNQIRNRFDELNTGDPSRNVIEMIFRAASTIPSKHSMKIKKVFRVNNPIETLERIIQSGFNTEHIRKNGIQLSTSCQDMSENMMNATKGKNVKRAVIVCRTIAGRVLRVVNMVDGENQEYDSIGSGGLCSKLEYLIVQNPTAVLPCFVIVFN
ncbi:hypothetical protein F0562_010003 [Nyssa sinensis]|uniref:Uncharacterized protein n=1 Tax=Nyssa sinensis TaxID=561372 RepID=A0A5J4ZZ97_9ASTE|nr:hypothetical protein F0562_010003 [Nyssa sinensis]